MASSATWVSAAVLALAAGLSARPAAAATCLGYGEPVTVRGVLTRRTFPGPPNYESVRRGDAAETFLVLRLDRPVCVTADPADKDGFSPGLDRVAAIQLLATAKDLGVRAGDRAVLTGTIFGAMSGHHHTPILLNDVAVRAGAAAKRP